MIVRLCESTNLDLVLPILPSAIGDEFIPKNRIEERQDLYPTRYILMPGVRYIYKIWML